MNDPQQAPQTIAPKVTARSSNYRPPSLTTLLLRAFTIAIVGAVVGVCIGFVVSLTIPPQYKAVALIEVSPPDAMDRSGNLIEGSLCNSDGGCNRIEGNALHEVFLIQSRATLEEAIEIGQFSGMHSFEYKSRAEIIAWLRDKNRLMVRPGTDEAATDIIEIAFRCEEAELAARVVAALVSGYEGYTQRVATESSRNKIEKLARFQDEFHRRAKISRDDYLRLSKATSIIPGDSDLRRSPSEARSEVEKSIVDIQVRKSKREALIATIQQALSNEDSDLESLLSTIARVEPTVVAMTPSNLVSPTGADENEIAKSASVARLEFIMKSMKIEVDTWQKEESLLQKIATDRSGSTNGRQGSILQLKLIEEEMEYNNEMARKLSSQLDSLQASSLAAGKSVHRIEMPSIGQLDRLDPRSHLMIPGCMGAAIFTSLFLVATTLRGLGRTD